MKSSEWDFSIGESEGTGTIRNASRPPQSRDKKTDVSYNQFTQRKALDSGYQGGYANRSAPNQSLESSVGKDPRAPYHHEHPDNQFEDVIDSYYELNELNDISSSHISKGEPRGVFGIYKTLDIIYIFPSYIATHFI